MEFVIEFIFDFIFDLIFEGGIEIAKNRKISKWIRYPVITVISLFIISLIILIGSIGIAMICSGKSYSFYGGFILIAFEIFLIILGTKRFMKELRSRKPEK